MTGLSPANAGAGDWLVDRIGPFGSGVGGVAGRGFPAYARILHPAVGPGDEPVRWAQVAGWSGRTLHPTAQFAPLTRPVPGAGRGTPPWDDEPETGRLAPALLAALCGILARHTGTPDECYFALWDGWGWIEGGPAVATFTAGTGETPPPPRRPVPPAFPPEVLAGSRLALPHRDYLVFTGPLGAALELGDQVTEDWFDPQSPSLCWPADHAWCLATDVDLPYSYVGGPPAAIEDILRDPRLEAWPAAEADPVTADSDHVNR